jgi:UDP-3-O-[3-hydroxymyristoyl] glucosamine N-acyltransferase
MLDNTSYNLDELAAHTGSLVVGDGSCEIWGLNTLLNANAQELSFLSNPAYSSCLASTQAGAIILHARDSGLFSGNKLITDNPYYTFALISQLFSSSPKVEGDIHSSVIFGASCNIANDVDIDANVVIGSNVTIGSGSRIGAGCYIGDNAVIDVNCLIYPNVSIYENTLMGKSCIVHSHAVIGSDGFGFAPKKDGKGGWQKVHQLGGVVIGSDVEVGAGTTIDRGALDNTVIENGVKLDNQIQIAHNVRIGENTAIAACSAIAGSTLIGKRCTIAGAVGVIGHLTITDDVHVTAMSLVTKSIPKSGSYSSGTPLNETAKWRKNAARFNRLDSIVRKFC